MNSGRQFGDSRREPGVSCQGLMRKWLLGEPERSSGLSFLGSPAHKSLLTKEANQLSICTRCVACFLEAEANITELKFTAWPLRFQPQKGIFTSVQSWVAQFPFNVLDDWPRIQFPFTLMEKLERRAWFIVKWVFSVIKLDKRLS